MLYSPPSNAAFRRLMSSFCICHNAFNIHIVLSVSLAFNISPTNVGTICHEMPYLSFSQPHSTVSPPSDNFSQNSSISSSGYQDLEDIEPITVAAYIEILQRQAAPPTVKQHMAAIRMLFSWLTEKGVLAMNPAREVKTERFSRVEGKTPAFVEGEVQKLLGVIETSTHTGLRDRALLGVLAYTFARIGAVVNLKVEDYYPSGKRFLLRFK